MDLLTRKVRHEQWLRLIEACNNRGKGITKKQWCLDHGIDRRQLYYWQRKFRNETALAAGAPLFSGANPVNTPVSSTFVDITDSLRTYEKRMSDPGIDSQALVPELMIQAGDLRIYISGAVQARTLETVMKVISRV